MLLILVEANILVWFFLANAVLEFNLSVIMGYFQLNMSVST